MVKWCVIGAGGIADRRTIPAILKDKNSTLVAIMDRKESTAKRLGEKYGVPYFTSEEEMLKTCSVDAVYIGTPVALHYSQSMLSLKYGKHVFVEKPMAMNEEESQQLLTAFKRANKHLTVGYMMKYHNLHQKTKEILSQNGIGKVHDIRAQFSCWYPDIENAWRQKKALGGGGAIMDLGVHAIELIEHLLGEKIVSVKSFYSTRAFSYEVEDSAVIIFKTQTGVLGHIDVNFNIPDNASESKLELYGDKGYIQCYGTLSQQENGVLKHLYAPQGDYSAIQNRVVDKPTEYYGEQGDLYLKQIQDFVNTLQSQTTDYTYTENAVHVQGVVDEIYKEK